MAFDEDLLLDAKTFDALRFFKLQQAKNKEALYREPPKADPNNQLVGVSRASLIWGYGRHVCPGRYFVANEMKMIIAEVLLHYELKNPPGITGRHSDIWYGLHVT
jgi:cytochrome P450